MMDSHTYKTAEEFKRRPEFYINDLDANIKKDIFRHLLPEKQQEIQKEILKIKSKMQGTLEKLTKNEISKDKAIKTLEQLSGEAHKLFQIPKQEVSEVKSRTIVSNNLKLQKNFQDIKKEPITAMPLNNEIQSAEKITRYREAEKQIIVVEEEKGAESKEENRFLYSDLNKPKGIVERAFALIPGMQPKSKYESGTLFTLSPIEDLSRKKMYYEFSPDPAESVPLEKRLIVVDLSSSNKEIETKVENMLKDLGIKPKSIKVEERDRFKRAPVIEIHL
jgi:hypothetical protein